MPKNHTEVIVSVLPSCDFCGAEAEYDAATIHGPWANMCPRHFRSESLGRLGLGVGQRLVVRPAPLTQPIGADSGLDWGRAQAIAGPDWTPPIVLDEV